MANWIGKAVKRPGRLTRAAKAAGVSKMAMAKKWAKSGDPSKRGAGILGERFMGGDLAKKRGKGLAGAISAARNK